MFRVPIPWLIALIAIAAAGCGRDKIDDLGPVGDFRLTERDGRTVSSDDLRGKVWIASFIFTRCTGPCPQVTGTMARLQKELALASEPDLRLVTFTVDPKRDDADELKRYAANFQAHDERWLFLTGKQEEVHDLVQKGFKLAVAENPNPGKVAGDEFDHSTRLVLVDRRGHIRGYFSGLPTGTSDADEKEFDANLAKLRRHVSALLKEQP